MKLADKEFDYYWKIIKIPLVLLIGYSVVGVVVAMVNYSTYRSIFNTWSGRIISLAIYGFIGWSAVKDHQARLGQSAWAGAITGVISGIAGAILYWVLLSNVPEFTTELMARATAQGAAVDPSIFKMGAYIQFITGPLLGGLLGAVISFAGGFVGKKVN